MKFASQKVIDSLPNPEISHDVAVSLLGQSLLIGLMLMLVTILATRLWSKKSKSTAPLRPTAPIPTAIGLMLAGGENPSPVSGVPAESAEAKDERESSNLREIVLSCSNVLFLAFAMCGVIILVNNDLARAFALGAAIALVRFRIKLNGKTMGSAMLFAIVTGMACGIGQNKIGWGIGLTYSVLQLLLIVIVRAIPEERKGVRSRPAAILPEALTGRRALE